MWSILTLIVVIIWPEAPQWNNLSAFAVFVLYHQHRFVFVFFQHFHTVIQVSSFAQLITEQTHGHYVLLEFLDLCQVHLTEEVRRRHSLSFSTRPSALSIRPGHRPSSCPCFCPALEVAVTSGTSDQRHVYEVHFVSHTPRRKIQIMYNQQRSGVQALYSHYLTMISIKEYGLCTGWSELSIQSSDQICGQLTLFTAIWLQISFLEWRFKCPHSQCFSIIGYFLSSDCSKSPSAPFQI